MKQKISGYVVSYNREDIIQTTLRSLSFVDELILIDKGSTDKTIELARSFVDKIIEVPWSPTVEETRKYAESVCQYEWIIFLDDDECLSVEAINFIRNEMEAPRASIYKIPQRHFIAGIHSEKAYYWPESQIRLYRKGAIEFINKVHGGYNCLTDDIFQIPFDSGACLYHFSHKSVSEWIEKANRYTSQVDRLRMSDPGAGNDLVLYSQRAILKWVQKKDIQGLEGEYEAVAALLRAIYDIIDRLKVWEEERGIDGANLFKKKCFDLDRQYSEQFDDKNRITINAKFEEKKNTIAGGEELVCDSDNVKPSLVDKHIIEEIDLLRNELKKFSLLLDHEKEENKALFKSLEEARRSSADEIKHLENLVKSEKESYENFQRAIYSSISWRFSAPIRFLSNKLRALVRNIIWTIRKIILVTGRAVFYCLPVRLDTKNIFVCSIYQTRLGGIFKGMPHYEAYLKSLQPRSSSFVPASRASKSIMIDEIDQVIDSIKFTIDLRPELTIIIPTYGNLLLTLNCLRSISNNLPKCSYEVLVIEDASGDVQIQKINGIKNIRFIQNENNLGFTLSCNQAASKANGTYLYFLNNDTEVLPNAIDSLIQTAKSLAHCGMVGSKLIYPSGHLQEAGGIVWAAGNAWNYGRMGDPNAHEFNYLKEVDYCSGASILIKKELFFSVGCFDEAYAPAYCEDTDLAFKVRKVGLSVIYQPQSEVIHFEGMSHGTDIASGIKSYQAVNQSKFQGKWAPILSNQVHDERDVFWARDRSSKKKTFLFIDHHLPKFDQDAGSKTISQIIDFLLEKNIHVVYYPINLAYDPIYTPHFQQRGVEVLYSDMGPKYLQKYLSEYSKYLDSIFISRPSVAKEIFEVLADYPLLKTIYYGHDIHYQRMIKELESEGKFPVNNSIKDMQSVEQRCWESFDVIFYPSNEEVNFVENYLSEKHQRGRVRRLPIFRYEADDVVTRKIAERPTGLIFVGGFGHAPNLTGLVWFLDKVWPIIAEHNPEIKLHIVGSNTPYAIKERASDSILVHGHISDEDLRALYSAPLISIAPLLFGAGVKGKVVEAIRWGLPVVTTSVGNQGLDGIESGILVADTPAEFIDKVNELMQDIDLYNFLSNSGIYYVRKNYSTSAMTQAFEGLLV